MNRVCFNMSTRVIGCLPQIPIFSFQVHIPCHIKKFQSLLLTCKYFPFFHTCGLFCLENDSLKSWIPLNFFTSLACPLSYSVTYPTFYSITLWKDKFNMPASASVSPCQLVAATGTHSSIKGTVSRYPPFQLPTLEAIHVFLLYDTSHLVHT